MYVCVFYVYKINVLMVNSTYCHLPIILRLLHLNKFTYLLNELQNVANASANKNKWTCQVLHRTAIYGIPSTVVMRKKNNIWK